MRQREREKRTGESRGLLAGTRPEIVAKPLVPDRE